MPAESRSEISLDDRAQPRGSERLAKGSIDPPRGGNFQISRRRRLNAAAPQSRPMAAPSKAPGGLVAQLTAPSILIVVGLAVAVADLFVARSTGVPIAFGPVRLRWLAVALAVVGVAWALWSFTSDKEQ